MALLQPQYSVVPPRAVLVVVPGGPATVEPSPEQAQSSEEAPLSPDSGAMGHRARGRKRGSGLLPCTEHN